MSQIETTLRENFETCRFIENQSAFRCERVFAGRHRATFFFAETESLPTRERVDTITANLVSPSYFEAQDAARWSHYLVFVAPDKIGDSAGFKNTKRDLEADRAYSRKFLICNSELKSFLDHSVADTASAAPSADLVSTWMKILGENGLAEIAAPGPRAPVVRSVQNGTNQRGSEPDAIESVSVEPTVSGPASSRFLERLSIKQFGTRKLRGEFSFATVNLIRGPNGSGKTSLLESIEQFICGATVRSLGSVEFFEAVASFPGRPAIPFRQLSAKQAQDKDARWYGRTFSKGNHLPEGFARYNFLNTDAAVDFSHDDDLKDLQTALSKISLGPQVSFIWDRLEQFEQDFSNAVSPIRTAIGRLNSSLLVARARLEALSQPSPLLAAQVRKFAVEATELGSAFPDVASLGISEEWLAQFSPLREFAARLNPFSTYSSIAEVTRRRDLLEADEASARKLVLQSKAIAADHAQQSNRLAELGKTKLVLHSAMRFVKSNVPQLLQAQRDALAKSESLQAPPVAISELDSLFGMPEVGSSLSADGVRAFLRIEESSMRQAVETAEINLRRLTSRASASASLYGEMRALAEKFASLHPDLTSCPVCRTNMEHADFVARLAAASNQDSEFALQQAHAECQQASAALHLAEERGRVLDRAIAWHVRPGEPKIEDLRSMVAEVLSEIEVVRSQQASIAASLSSLEAAGLSIDEFWRLDQEIRQKELCPSPEPLNESALIDALNLVSTSESEVGATAQRLSQELEKVKAELAKLAARYPGDDNSELLTRINQELKLTLEFLASFERLPAGNRLALGENLASNCAAVEAIAKLLAELNLEFRTEKAKGSDLSLISEQVSREELELGKLTGEHDRLDSALRIVRMIRESHSLEAGMSEFLNSNLGAIQRIFERIHLPRELKVSSLANCSLERHGQAGLVHLNQISTGQRAALVLSIFCTLNLSLKDGPPMMLIDDPVAHVDDLNTLSFLDFVADIAESGRRQVFFATASEKLANLFAKKMEFLGDDFRAISLPAN